MPAAAHSRASSRRRVPRCWPTRSPKVIEGQAEVEDLAARPQRGADEAQPAEHARVAEARVQRFVVAQAVEDRQHVGAGLHRRRDRVHRVVQVVGLAAEQDQIEARLAQRVGQLGGGQHRHAQVCIAERADQLQAVLAQPRGAGGPQQEGDVRAGLRQASAEVAAGAAGAEDQDAHAWSPAIKPSSNFKVPALAPPGPGHDTRPARAAPGSGRPRRCIAADQLRSPTPLPSSRSPSAPSARTKPIISA